MQGFIKGRSDFAGRATAAADTGYAPEPAAHPADNKGAF
jgi:hypothetical protein